MNIDWQIETRSTGRWEPIPELTGFATRLEAQEAFVMRMAPQTRFGSAQYMRAQFRWLSRAHGVRVAKADA